MSKYAQGGPIPGGGGPKDDRIVFIAEGCFRVSPRVRKRYGRLLDRINTATRTTRNEENR